MKFTPWFLAGLAPFAAVAYNGYLGHALVVVLTVGIFLGTLSLGRNVPTPLDGPGPQAQVLPPAPVDHV